MTTALVWLGLTLSGVRHAMSLLPCMSKLYAHFCCSIRWVQMPGLTISLRGSHYEDKEGFLFQMAMKLFREDPASFVSSALPLFLLLLLGLLLDYVNCYVLDGHKGAFMSDPSGNL